MKYQAKNLADIAELFTAYANTARSNVKHQKATEAKLLTREANIWDAAADMIRNIELVGG